MNNLFPIVSKNSSHGRKKLVDFPVLEYAGFDYETTQRLLFAISDHSRFLFHQLTHRENASTIEDLFRHSPRDFCRKLREELKPFHEKNRSFRVLSNELRLFRNRTLLSIALGDLSGHIGLEESTCLVSELAEYVVDKALLFLLRQARFNKIFSDNKNQDDSIESLQRGYTVLGMGKLGARELNFSSDIDLIILYDSKLFDLENKERTQEEVNRITRKLCLLLNDKTAYGHVFRTDLRLRPDPSSNPIAVNILSAEIYYETLGRNWERAALLKARPIAGDIKMGKMFLETLHPFVWRRNLDFDAIRDIFFLQQQRSCRKGVIKGAGCNVKLSEGGIRDIEFFIQSLQLVWGGRNAKLRVAETGKALKVLQEAGLISDEVSKTLYASYCELRRIEHRLQLQNDEQTHIVPSADGDLENFALFCGFATGEQFICHLESIMSEVWEKFQKQVRTFIPREVDEDLSLIKRYEQSDQSIGDTESNALLAGFSWHGDEKTEGRERFLSVIKEMGYTDSDSVLRLVQGWYQGNTKVVSNDMSRRFLLNVLPELLRRLGNSSVPQDAIVRFDRFVRKLPIGFPLFSLFGTHRHVLEAITTVIADAPRIANYLAKRPVLVDALLAREYQNEFEESEKLEEELESLLVDARDDEDVLHFCRRFLHEKQFCYELAWLEGRILQNRALEEYTKLVEVVLLRIIRQAEISYWEGKGSENMAVWSMGKLGHRAMMPSSDFDLVFVHRIRGDSDSKEGQFTKYQRLARRIVSFIESRTKEGIIGQVDLRLRPYGKSGALSQDIDTISRYYREGEAWIVEYMALSHARGIFGDKQLLDDLGSIRDSSLRRGFEKSHLQESIRNILVISHIEHSKADKFQIKYARGGLFDLEFFVQYGLLLCARESSTDYIPTDTLGQIMMLEREGFLDKDCSKKLQDAWNIMIGMQAFRRLTGWDMDGSESEMLRDEALAKMLRRKEDSSKIVQELGDYTNYIHELMVSENIAPDY